VLEPAEILFFLHTFPQHIINLLDILSPQDIKDLIKEEQRRRQLEGCYEVRRMSAEESEELLK